MIYPGDEIQVPADPVKDGYYFIGWSLDGKNVVDFSTIELTEDTTFVPLFEEITTTSVSLFTFKDGAVTGYSGDLTEISIPRSYSLGEEEIIKEQIYNDYTSLEMNRTYPYTLIDSNNVSYEIDSQETLFNYRYDIVWPSNVIFKKQNFVNGKDFIVTEISESAFSNQSALTSIEIPDNITKIGNYAFFGCTSLTKVIIPEGVVEIGAQAFQNCSNLESVQIPDSVKILYENTFNGCENLIFNKINESDVGNYIGNANNPFLALVSIDDKEISNITISEKTKVIVPYLFQNCTNLTEITLPSGIEEITAYAFAGCTNLTEITLPNSLKIIGNSAFLSSGITNIEIPEGVTIIEDNAFSYCGNLTQIVIPDSVVTIKGGVFFNCSNLTEIIIGKNVTEIGMDTFPQSSALKVYLNCDKVPTLIKGNSSIFAKFYVKDELYDEYIASAVWSDISTQIYRQSEEA